MRTITETGYWNSIPEKMCNKKGHGYILGLRKISRAFAYGEYFHVILKMIERLTVYHGALTDASTWDYNSSKFATLVVAIGERPGWKVVPDFWISNIGFVHSLKFYECNSLTDMDCYTIRTVHNIELSHCGRVNGFGLLQLTRGGGQVRKLEIRECPNISDVEAFGRNSSDSRLFGCYPGDMTTVPLHTLIIGEILKRSAYSSTKLITDISCLSNSNICELILIGCVEVKDIGSLIKTRDANKSCSIRSLNFSCMDLGNVVLEEFSGTNVRSITLTDYRHNGGRHFLHRIVRFNEEDVVEDESW